MADGQDRGTSYAAKHSAGAHQCQLLIGRIRAVDAGKGSSWWERELLARELGELGHTALGVVVMHGTPLRKACDDLRPGWGV